MIPVIYKRIVRLGLISIWRHRLRSSLTILGIVFGVCSVIAMLAIGEGASFEAKEQIKQLGSQNIIVQSVKPPQSQSVNSENQMMIEYGLTYKDAERINATIPSVEVIVPQRDIRTNVAYRRTQLEANIIGTVSWYPQITNQRVKIGRFFNDKELKDDVNVCVLSAEAPDKLFAFEYPLGKVIKVKTDYYEVIGVMDASIVDKNADKSGTNINIFVPITTTKSRFGEIVENRSSGSQTTERVELHRITVKVKNQGDVLTTSKIIKSILQQEHKKLDYEIIIPLELLRQAKRTERIFNIVLGSIAAISLLVGGIGIMNIMLASVTERTREIGIRRALGAKRKDIIIQFLTETILLSSSGGVIGVVIGVLIPFFITHFAEMKTIVSLWSVVAAFGISLMIGVVFGIYPAYRASVMDPITALRHE